MEQFLSQFNYILADSYFIMPVLTALFICLFMKNPIRIRRVYKTFFIVSFCFCAFFIFLIEPFKFDLFHLSYDFSNLSLFLSLILNFIFLIFSYISKPLIHKNHKAYYTLSLVYFSLINLFLFCENILIVFLSLFWIFLIRYFISFNFSYSKETKTSIKLNLSIDFLTLIISGVLIGYDFLRYFMINNIEFTFKNIVNSAPLINDSSINLAFIGFLLMIFNLIKLLGFDGNNLNNINKINPLCICHNSMGTLFLAGILLIKTYYSFDWMFFNHQNAITIYLLINMVYFAFLNFKQNSFLRFCLLAAKISFLAGFLLLFSFSDSILGLYFYYLVTLILSIGFLFMTALVLFSKYKTDKISRLFEAGNKNKLLSFFTLAALLNIAKIPLLPMFSSTLYVLSVIFSIQYETTVMELMPYVLLFSLMFLSYSSFDLIYHILIEAKNKRVKTFPLMNHQILGLILTIFFLFLMNFSPDYFIGRFLQIETLGI